MTARPIDRRRFLTGSALAVAGAGTALAGCSVESSTGGGAAAPPSSPTGVPTDLSSWGNVRAQFDLDPEFAHFSAFVLAAHPASVRAAIEQWRKALDADPATVVGDAQAHDETVREAAARYLGVAPSEIALTDSTTAGLGLVYHGLRLVPGDHVLTTTHDFYSTHEALRLAAERTAARVERIALYDNPAEASAEEMVARLRAAVRPATRVVALTWVHSSTGVKLPVRDVADALAEINRDREPARWALLCLDAVHGLGADDARPGALGCDVYIAGTHKWLFGPRGTGLVWVGESAGEAIAPIIPPFNAAHFRNWLTGGDAPSPVGLSATPGGYKPYEHRWAVADAFEFHLAIGRERVATRTRELATRLKNGLAELGHVRLITPRDPALSAGIVCCDVDGDPGEVLQRLRREHRILASFTPYRERYLRFGTSIVTSPEQVDAAVEAVADLG